MTDFIAVNQIHLELLRPLLKWRILDIDSLRKEIFNVKSRHNFYRLVRDLEKKKLLIGFRDPYTKKKYVYLSPLGENQYSLKENPTAVSTSTLSHDTKVSQLSRQMLNLGWIQDVELEHSLQDKKRLFNTTTRVIPDALFTGQKNGIDFKIAFELELTQKKSQRIVEKAREYLLSDSYDYVLYLFLRPELMTKYSELITEATGKSIDRFMFFSCPDLMEKNIKLDQSMGRFNNKELRLKDLFLSN